MKTKSIWITALMFSLFANIVYAQEIAMQRISDMFYRIFNPIFGKWVLGGIEFTFWARFLIWILLFAVLYWVGAAKVFKNKRNIAGVVAGVVALISVVGIPQEILVGIFETYGVVVSSALFILPVAGILWLLNKAFDEPTPTHFGIKAVAFYIMSAVIVNFANASQGLPGYTATAEVAMFASGVCIILFMWYLIRAILALGGPGGAPGEIRWPWGRGEPTPERPAEPARPEEPEVPYPADLAGHITHLSRMFLLYENALQELNQIMHGIDEARRNRQPFDLEPYRNKCAEIGAHNTRIAQLINHILTNTNYENLNHLDQTNFINDVVRWSNRLRQVTAWINDFEFNLNR